MKYDYSIHDDENHSSPLSINKKFRLSKEQMKILSTTDMTSHLTGMHIEEMVNNIIDEKKIRTYGRDFLLQKNSPPRYIIRSNGMREKSKLPELSYRSNHPENDHSILKYFSFLIKWLFSIITLS